jgi:arylsulfatase
MIARTDLVQGDGSQYMKVLCSPTKSVEEWAAEMEERKAAGSNPSPDLIGDRVRFAYFGGDQQIPKISSPNVENKSHTITAYVDRPGDGVLVAHGGAQGGYALFVKDGKPAYEFNRIGLNRYRVTSSEPLPVGKSTIRVEFSYSGGAAKVSNVKIFLNDRIVAEGRVRMTDFPLGSREETFDIGLDSGSPVSDQYASPFKFSGVINRVVVTTATRE